MATRIQLLRVCYENAEVKQLDGEIATKINKCDPAANPRLDKKGRKDSDPDK